MTLVYVAMTLGMVAAVGVFITIWSFVPATPSNADVVEGRLRVYESGLPVSLTEMELQQPFTERVVRPTIKRLGHLFEQTMPEKARHSIHQRLQLAGRPSGMSTSDFIAVRYVLTGILTCAGIFVGALLGKPALIAVGAALGGVLGLYLPMFWLRSRVNRRRSDIQLDLPDVIDVLIVCVEAGLTFEAAMQKVADKYDHALAEEIGRVLQEIRLGRGRLDALSDLGHRTGVEELNNFVQAIIQSEQLGAGVARILRIQSDEIRQRRLMSAQERGARASLKMLLPMIGCIFPTLWIILLGPAALLAFSFFRSGL
ncbi:MAG: type II secretion system F family protein [Chloroflexi bacterium]|nr:MAG: type II secretion system F family protein [Chloroflexota bacterium]TME98341.1 MAG: type II secretion system F family protein [Chloroflexota bacterium]